MMYSVIPIDEGEETDDLIKVIGGKPTDGFATEIKDDADGLATHPLRQKQIFDSQNITTRGVARCNCQINKLCCSGQA